MSAPRKEVLSDTVTLFLGDCRDVLPMIGRVGSVITDPPYGMSFRSNYRIVKHDSIANDADLECLNFAIGIEASHSRYVFCRWDNIRDVPKPKSCITWVKNNWSMGDLDHEHARQTEVALFYPGPLHYFPKGRPQDVVHAPRTGNDNHPSEKPVQLMRVIVEWTDGVVLDPFMGSGSTGCAAVDVGRSFIGIEIDSRHFDTARRRISAALASPRLPFEEPIKPKQESLFAQVEGEA
jgi:site-specific DNA-methyltransferase (adenine-specific)